MAMIETEIKRWGNSFGIVIPISEIERNKFKDKEKVSLLIIKDSKRALKETFGLAKGKISKSSQQIKDELREDLYE